MAKSSVAVRSSARRSTPTARSAGSAATATNSAVASSSPLVSETELEAIWKTYKRTHDENLRNTLIEHHMPLVRTRSPNACCRRCPSRSMSTTSARPARSA